jgi:diaminopimelate epimerase
MIDVHEVKVSKKSIFTDTGSPHHVEIVDHLDDYPVVKQARKIINTNYSTEGCNINFVEQLNDESFKVRTYERGVENETLACGTGATAVAIAMHKINKSSSNHIKLAVLGGNLEVQFNAEQGSYTNIVLSGPAAFVFEGTIAIS